MEKEEGEKGRKKDMEHRLKLEEGEEERSVYRGSRREEKR